MTSAYQLDELDRRIIALRKKNWRNRSIATRLKISYSIVVNRVHRLIQVEVLERQSRGQPMSQCRKNKIMKFQKTAEAERLLRERRHEMIAHLRNRGLSNQQIADRLDISKSTVAAAVSGVLIPQGKVKSQWVTEWKNLEHPLVQRIILQKNKGGSLRKIATLVKKKPRNGPQSHQMAWNCPPPSVYGLTISVRNALNISDFFV